MEESREHRIKVLKRQLRVIYGKLQTLGLLECVTDTEKGKPDAHCSSGQVSVQLGELTREVDEFYERLPQLPDTNNPTKIIDYSAAAALREYLASHGGPLGGWDEKDHLTFLQYFNRFGNNTEVLFHKLETLLPGKTTEDIEAHTSWFKELCSLQEAQKAELKEWKAKRQAEVENRKQELSESSESYPEDMQRWVSTWRQQREVILKKLQQWRESKATKPETNKEECREAKNTTGAKALNTAEREYKVLLSHLRKREKTAAKMATAQTAAFVTDLERRERAAASKKKIQLAHQKNIKHVLKRREQIMASRNAANRIQTAHTAGRNNASRDPTRLLRPTTALIAKQLYEDLDQSPKVHYILDVSHRATPTWREAPSASF